MFLIAFAAITVGFGLEAVSQSPTEFEVASVKPFVADRDSAVMAPIFSIDQAFMTMRGQSLKGLIAYAYSVGSERIVGPGSLSVGPAGIVPRFSISAKLPAGASKDDAPKMLQALLRERFFLKVHWETRTVKGYRMTVENADLLKRSKATDGDHEKALHSRVGSVAVRETSAGREATFLDASMSQFANVLKFMVGNSPIIDATDALGTYTIVVRLTQFGESSATPPDPECIAESLRKYGLKLESAQFPLVHLVVDSVKMAPTEN